MQTEIEKEGGGSQWKKEGRQTDRQRKSGETVRGRRNGEKEREREREKERVRQIDRKMRDNELGMEKMIEKWEKNGRGINRE